MGIKTSLTNLAELIHKAKNLYSAWVSLGLKSDRHLIVAVQAPKPELRIRR